MRDLVVTVPRNLWADWLSEGDLPGDAWSGVYWSFYVGGGPPRVSYLGEYDPELSWAESKVRSSETFLPAGESDPARTTAPQELVFSRRQDGAVWRLVHPDQRVYVVAGGAVRGYSPLYAVEVDETGRALIALIRQGGAMACTISETVRGFRGYRYRWWGRSSEIAFPDWMTRGFEA